MEHVTSRLRALRKQAEPSMSIRAMANALGVPPSTYAFYENPSSYKKNYLPLDLARRLANILSLHGVKASDVLELTGMTHPELDPEVSLIEGKVNDLQIISLSVALPSHEQLKTMCLHLLMGCNRGDSLNNFAERMARALPASLAAYSKHTNEVAQLAVDRYLRMTFPDDRSS